MYTSLGDFPNSLEYPSLYGTKDTNGIGATATVVFQDAKKVHGLSAVRRTDRAHSIQEDRSTIRHRQKTPLMTEEGLETISKRKEKCHPELVSGSHQGWCLPMGDSETSSE